MQTISYNRRRADDSGRKKYTAKKKRYLEQIHSYINHELNRFLRTEKPQTVYIVKLPRPRAGGVNKKINNSVALWQRGYIIDSYDKVVDDEGYLYCVSSSDASYKELIHERDRLEDNGKICVLRGSYNNGGAI